MADRIPNEIWLKALGFAPTEALTCISLTSRRFCALSRPHIFAEFRFRPYAIGDKGLLLPKPPQMKKASDRLKFWLSDEIAPFVRVCTITPFAKTSKFSTSDEPYALLAAFFDGLVSFTGLQILTADNVHFTQIGLSNLCLLTNLHTLRLEAYKLSPPGHVIDFSGLQLRNLRSLRFPIAFTSDRDTDHSEWIPLLDADNVRELELSLHQPHALEIDHLPLFPRASALAIHLDLSNTPKNLHVVAKFPALQSLLMVNTARLNDERWDSSSLHLAASELPLSLKQYTGPFQALHLLLPLPNLTSITIAECPPPQFFEELRGIRAPKITSLSIAFRYFDSVLFEQLCEIFSAVIRLKIIVGDAEGAAEDWELEDFDPANYDWKVPAYLEALVASLPPRIKHLAMHWYMDFEFNDELPPFRKFADVLMKKHRGLSALWLGMYGYTVRSLKSATGKIAAKEDLLDDTPGVVKRIDEEFSSSWDVLAAHI